MRLATLLYSRPCVPSCIRLLDTCAILENTSQAIATLQGAPTKVKFIVIARCMLQ